MIESKSRTHAIHRNQSAKPDHKIGKLSKCFLFGFVKTSSAQLSHFNDIGLKHHKKKSTTKILKRNGTGSKHSETQVMQVNYSLKEHKLAGFLGKS